MPDEQVPPTEPIAPKKKRRKLTQKQEAVARAVVRDPNASLSQIGEVAGLGGPTKTVKAVNAWRTLQKDHVKDRIRELLNKRKDTSLVGLSKTLAEGLNATDTQYFQKDGEVTDERTTVDHATRHRYLETALELHGAREKEVGGVTNNFFTKDAIEAFVTAFKRPPAT